MATSTIQSHADYIESQGTTNSWTWRKWKSGRYEAERIHNVGQYTINTTVVSGIMCGGTLNTPSPPHTLTSGNVSTVLLGNSSNSGVWLEKITNTSFRVCKATGSNVTLQNLTFTHQVVGGKWK